MKKRQINVVLWHIRVFVITVVIIILITNIFTIENERLKYLIGAYSFLAAMWINKIIGYETN